MARLVLAAISAVFVSVSAFAHHGYETYIQDQLMWVKGGVAEFRYAQPHATLSVRDAAGRVYEGEWGTLNLLTTMNVTRDSLKPGDRVIVIGRPQRDPRILKIHLKAVHRTSDGWHWPRCASASGPYDCTIPTGPYRILADGSLVAVTR